MESTRADWSRRATTREVGGGGNKKRTSKWKSAVRRTTTSPSVRFGLRLSFALTAASLFVLIPYPPGSVDESWPQGSWVFTTVVLCSWFPSQPVAASVVQKTYHRVLGTTVGAIFGLCVGFAVISIPGRTARGVFLGLMTALASFLWGFTAVEFKQWFGGYNYAAVLVLMTYGIVVWPFYLSSDNDEIWKRACYRVANVLIGCALSGLSAILVFPKTTKSAIEEKAESQIRRAGMSSEAVLTAAVERFSGNTTPLCLSEVVRRKVSPAEKKDEEEDTTLYDSYMTAVQEFLSTKALFSLLDYDPFHLCSCKEKKIESMQDSAVNMARAFRIQTTVVLLDSIIRNDRGHRLSARQLELFTRAGQNIKSILAEQLDKEKSEADAFELVSILAQMRQEAIEAARRTQPLSALSKRTVHSGGLDVEEFVKQLKNQGGGQPMCSQSATILFLELVAHLILRALRLYFAGNLRIEGTQAAPRTSLSHQFGWEGDDDDGDDDE